MAAGRAGGMRGRRRRVGMCALREAEAVEPRDDEALRGGEESEEADHREAAVVDLGEERLGLAGEGLEEEVVG